VDALFDQISFILHARHRPNNGALPGISMACAGHVERVVVYAYTKKKRAMTMTRNVLQPSHLLVGLLLLLWLVGCTPVALPAPADAATMNLAQVADLATTTQVEIRTLDEASDTYLPTSTISDPAVLAPLIEALNQPLLLQPALFCRAQYELVFQLADGKALTFNYGCVAETGSYLQGGETPLQDQAIEPPAAFQALITGQTERQ